MIRRKPVPGLEPGMETGFPKRSCSPEVLERISLQSEAIFALGAHSAASPLAALGFFAATQGKDVLGVRLNSRLGDVIDHREYEYVLEKALHQGFQLRARAPINPGLTARGSRIVGGETVGLRRLFRERRLTLRRLAREVLAVQWRRDGRRGAGGVLGARWTVGLGAIGRTANEQKIEVARQRVAQVADENILLVAGNVLQEVDAVGRIDLS